MKKRNWTSKEKVNIVLALEGGRKVIRDET